MSNARASLTTVVAKFPRYFMDVSIIVMVGLLAAKTYDYIVYAVRIIGYPFGLDYGEGIVWQQTLMIPSKEMYGDITKYPFIVFHYPPLYHILTRLMTSLRQDWLAAGRTISVASTLLIVVESAGIIYSFSRRAFGRWASLAGAMIGGLTVLTHNAVVDWSPLMRVDMLAIGLSVSGLLLCMWSLESQVWLFGAVLFFVAGLYTKQTELAAPIAGIGPYLVLCPRRLILPGICGLGLAVAVLIFLSWQTEGGFLQHIVVYNVNRFDERRAYWAIRMLFYRNLAFFSVALAGAVIALVILVRETRARKSNGVLAHWKSNRFAWMIVTLLIYLALSTATLAGLGKSGAGKNYAIEWLCACNLFVGFALSAAIHRATSTKGVLAAFLIPLGPVVIVALLMIHVSALTYVNETEIRDANRQKQLVQLIKWIRAAPKLVLSDDMVLLMIAGKHVPLEPGIFAELSALGRWDKEQEIDLIKSQSFQFIITKGARGDYYYDNRYATAVADAIELAYPVEAAFAGYTIHLPKGNDCEVGPPLRCPPDVAGH